MTWALLVRADGEASEMQCRWDLCLRSGLLTLRTTQTPAYEPLSGFLGLSTIDMWGLRGFCCGAAPFLASVPTSSTPTVVQNHLQTLPDVT